MAYQQLEKLINLQDGYRRAFRLQQREVLLIQEAGERYLIDRHCPHAGQPLDSASIQNGVISCPRHGQCFSLRDGLPCASAVAAMSHATLDQAQGSESTASRPIPVHTLVYEGNTIGVDV